MIELGESSASSSPSPASPNGPSGLKESSTASSFAVVPPPLLGGPRDLDAKGRAVIVGAVVAGIALTKAIRGR